MDKAVLAVVQDGGGQDAESIMDEAAATLRKAETNQSSTFRVKRTGRGLKVFEVLYNPKSLSIRAEGKRNEDRGVKFDSQTESFSQSSLCPDVTLSVELQVTGTDTQQILEGMLGMMVSDSRRQVLFVWGKMAFPGKVESLRCTGNVFDPDGRITGGHISLYVRHGQGPYSAREWERIYEELKKEISNIEI